LLATVRDEAAQRREVLTLEGDLAQRLEFCGMVGRGPAMQDVFGLIRRLAPHVRTALVTGDTGTGKELVARALHKLGPRSTKRFVTVNCSAVVETLFESELFGHVRGAFTGATENKAGLFEMADGGTLFLDEVGELPLPVQAKLLRVLEEGEVRHAGSLGVARGDNSPAPLVEVEREHIIRTLQQVRGNKAVAARLLGISRRAFYRQLERHGLHQRIPMTTRTNETVSSS